MPTVRALSGAITDDDWDLVVVPVFKGGIEGPGAQSVLDALGMDGVPAAPDFRGEIGEHVAVAAPGARFGAALFVGLGRMDEVDAERLRRAAGLAAGHAQAARVATTLAQVHPTAASVSAVVEGFLMGEHREERFRSTPRPHQALEELTVLVPSALLPAANRAVQRGRVYARATLDARRLVDTPPNHKRPPDLADTIVELARDCCEATVRDEHWLAERGYGGLLAVGAGSSAPPRLVELRYRPAEPLGTIVLAGKGISYDTGGLSLKRDTSLARMKSDMAGAAAIAAACAALGAIDCGIEVVALLGLAENMPGASAQRPGDILTSYDGTTIEVLDTDAEGRLVLADLLAAGAEAEPDALVDCATLTGSAITALGRYCGAVLGTDETLVDALLRAGASVGETLWRLPLLHEYERFLESPVADCNNTADGPGAGAITAALFLQRFAAGVPWAHLDIAGPAMLTEELARDYLPIGGTGFGARTLLAWMEGRAE